jgi:hypothetical protein
MRVILICGLVVVVGVVAALAAPDVARYMRMRRM